MNHKEVIESLNKYRDTNHIFKRSVEERSSDRQVVMFDGPPFASGAPHFGHGLTSTMKDIFGRYNTMKGYKVVRNRGWDCHGLPVEKFVEKKLGIDGKKEIEKLGIEKFVEECRNSVKHTNSEWNWFIRTLGRWADMDHAYFTMDLDFMESVMRVFQSLYNRNLVYKGFKIQGFCPSCATGLSNSEINDGYQDRQDPAITIKFSIENANITHTQSLHTVDGFTNVAKAIINKDDKIFLLQRKDGRFCFPGAMIAEGTTPDDDISNILQQKCGIKSFKSNYLGTNKIVNKTNILAHYYEIETKDEPLHLDKNNYVQSAWAEIIESDNKLGFAINIDGTITDDPDDIIRNFLDIYLLKTSIITDTINDDKPVSFLAWTTTPWTLPSNMFLAVGKYIKYIMIYDYQNQEYFVLAEDLVSKYYKDSKEYCIINRFDGEILQGIKYKPLFPYITQSKIADKYKDKFFQIITGTFVSTDAGTGIVHQAPAFGEDDFNAVCQILPQDESLEWLFLPVDEYGEFDDQVYDYKGIRVYDANKDIIKRLKEEGNLIAQGTINHSYPHCRRCDTPLIYKAIDSRFIKEHNIASDSVENIEKINFVPNTVKNRFRDVLKSAPDRNVSRKRYRGAPIPIWEEAGNKTYPDRKVIGNLDELYFNTKDGSANINRNIFIRHGRTNNNDLGHYDGLGTSILTDLGKEQAQLVKTKLNKFQTDKDIVVVVSPLQRTFNTILPYLESIYDTSTIKQIKANYKQVQEHYKTLRDSGELKKYLFDRNSQKQFELAPNILVDLRITDLVIPEYQDKPFSCSTLHKIPNNQLISDSGESINEIYQRTSEYIEDINSQFKSHTIITVSHADIIVLMIKRFRNFVFNEKRNDYKPSNGNVSAYYRDLDRKTEVDLHKPYVDNYWFKIDNKIYKRIPEVLDCWFESGTMPYGQVNYLGESLEDDKLMDKNQLFQKYKGWDKFPYPADFIIEGLDQTRGRFRTLHILGNGLMKKNAFNNVVINGLILAEDGKKMSKKLRNYPDPRYLFEKYGSDAYRLYLSASPAVRAEPVKFTERGVEQIYKDFTAALENSFNFFSTYAKVDNYKYNAPNITFVRHAKAEGVGPNATLTAEGEKSLKESSFVESILRCNIDTIYTSNYKRAQSTAQAIADIVLRYTNKSIDIKVDERFSSPDEILQAYQDIIDTEGNKNVLLVGHNFTLSTLWDHYYQPEETPTGMGNNLEIVPLPTYQIINDLDKWILAELNQVIMSVEENLNLYHLDSATKTVLSFIEKLTNRYIRRSRRRFWASGLNSDKISAYNTLFNVLDAYLKLCAPFAPFVSEYLWLKLQEFKGQKTNKDSIHLQHFPIASQLYIDKQLLEEIAVVRRIISIGLFIRSKNNIKIKQPLQKMEIKMT